MKILVAGMARQKAAALAMLVEKMQPGWHTECVDDLTELARAQGDVGVLDLSSLGLHRHSEASARVVLHALGGKPGILLTTLHDQTWSEWLVEAPDTGQISLLRKPCNAAGMRQALQRHATKNRASSSAEPRPALGLGVPDEGQLDVDAFMARVDQRAAAQPSLFLQIFAEALKSGQSFEVRLTLQHCIVVCSELHWIATNTPASVIQRLVQSDGLASVAQVRSIDSAAGLNLARRLNMEFQPTNIFLWELLYPPTTDPGASMRQP